MGDQSNVSFHVCRQRACRPTLPLNPLWRFTCKSEWFLDRMCHLKYMGRRHQSACILSTTNNDDNLITYLQKSLSVCRLVFDTYLVSSVRALRSLQVENFLLYIKKSCWVFPVELHRLHPSLHTRLRRDVVHNCLGKWIQFSWSNRTPRF